MPRKTEKYYADVARQSQEKAELRRKFQIFLEKDSLDWTEQNARIYAFSCGLSSCERENLVSVLMSVIHLNKKVVLF